MVVLNMVMAAVATSIAAPVILPLVGGLVSKFALTPIGRFAGTWAIAAVLYDVFVTPGEQFRQEDLAISGAIALVTRVVL